MIKHLLFDLDGTLLPIDLDFFFRDYLLTLSNKFDQTINQKEFMEKLLASTMVMIENKDQNLTNEKVFWNDFPIRIGFPRSELEPIFLSFYYNEYRQLGCNLPPAPRVRKTLECTLKMGFTITIATNPIFPEYALIERLSWINCHDLPFQMVTSMENMHFCKPNPEYYQEIIDLLGVKEEECLMIGNDVEEDLIASLLGIKTCLVTDRLISRGKFKVEPDYTCSFAELNQIIKELNL
mgnify:FL=1|jgi:FMN phosphatase YigB (HAD superfamily)